MSNKPKIFGSCAAGCLWETVHKSDFEKSASLIRQAIPADGKFYFEQGKEYKIFASKNSNGDFSSTIYFVFDMTSETDLSCECNDKYADSFTFRFLDYYYDEVLEYNVVVYEYAGVRYKVQYEYDISTVQCYITGATEIFLYNADATIKCEDGDSAFIRYSANADGSDFTEEWSEGQNYIGFATGQTAPTDKSGYKWCAFGSSGLPEVTETDNGKVLMVVDGSWQASALTIYSGEYEVIE